MIGEQIYGKPRKSPTSGKRAITQYNEYSDLCYKCRLNLMQNLIKVWRDRCEEI